MAKVSMSIKEFETIVKEYIGLRDLNMSKDVVEFDLCFDLPILKAHSDLRIENDRKEAIKKNKEELALRTINLTVPYLNGGGTFDVEIDLSWKDLADELREHGIDRKISLIKSIRTYTGLGLADAKAVVDFKAHDLLVKFKKYDLINSLRTMGNDQE